MSFVGEVILAVTTEMLFKKLASEVLPLFGRQEKIRADLLEWQRRLKQIKAVLDDAEEQQMTNDSVKIWLCELKNLAYDVEDIMDAFATKALERKLLHKPQPSTSKFRNLIPTCCTNFSPRSFQFDSRIRHKIDEISTRLQKITADKDLLELKDNSGGRSKKVEKRRPTSSLVNEAKVFGREKEKKEIIELLLRDDLITDDGFSVIPIVGMGGMGKTTLAQLVYNDKSVESYFDLKVWVCVSEDFDVTKVTKAILRSIDDGACEDKDLNWLQEKLRSKLRNKKFFLVLDDLWNEDRNDWELLSLPFAAGTPESKIVVTTRSTNVASIVSSNVGSVTPYELSKLSDDDCLLVFTQHSLGTRDFSMHKHLKETGVNIVKKCDGLPLAAKTLGSLLRHKNDQSYWRTVQDSKIWELPEEKCGIMRALRVSYHYLPAHLKQCFAYCSLLPKDYEFREQEIVFLWMAEGFLQSDTNVNKMEETGRDYFQELQSRSFFQQSSVDTSSFVMHDLINDLAQWAAGEMHFRREDMSEANKQQKVSKSLRHFSYIIGQYDGPTRFETISDAENLRTFLPVKLTFSILNLLSHKVVDELLKRQNLRVLSLRGYHISKIPTVRNLTHLRHLDLSGTLITALPESVNTLYNLHTLLLRDCHQLKTLCADIGNLIKLRHLNNSNAYSLKQMPLGIGKLTCLQTLSYFVVGKDSGSRLRELNSLENLQGKLEISGLENVNDVGDLAEAELNRKKKLNELFLKWSCNPREPETETLVLDMLRPHEALKQLTIMGFGGKKFPTWLGDSRFSNLVDLRFEDCNMCTSLPTVGQLPVLKHLSIVGMAGVKSVGQEFYGSSVPVAFPLLETLYFKNLPEWENWIPHGCSEEVEVFPQLRELSLIRCRKLLGRLPERFASLERLVVRECKQLLVSIPSIPSLCKLEIDACKNVQWKNTIYSSSSNSLVPSDMSEQVFPTGLLKQELPNVKELTIKNTTEQTYLWRTGAAFLQDISSLHQLLIASYPQLLFLVAEEEENQQQQGLECRLHSLKLSGCQRLVKLPAQALLCVSSLKEIEISKCDAVESLPEAWMRSSNMSLEKLSIISCNSLTCIARVRLPSSLKQIKICGCKNLRTLIDEDEDQVSVMELAEDFNSGCSRYTSVLERLDIFYCQSLTSLLSKSELPATLERIEVSLCSKLASLSSSGNLPKALNYLHISECPEIESLAEGLDNSTSLEEIIIIDCQNLRFLPNCLYKARHLQNLFLSSCPKIVSFPVGGLPCTKLSELSIINCEKLKALPKGTHNLTSLQKLEMRNCPSIELCSREDEDIFPTNIPSLRICYTKIYKPLFEWRLHRFTSIRKLGLHGECSDHLVSFPPEDTELALPASLKGLEIIGFRNMERLGSIFENVTSLESVRLSYCPKLEYFPEKSLPSSLFVFRIDGCPLISEKFKEDEGQYWPLISHVPSVCIE